MNATYRGDETYSIECTGDACVGDEVRFQRATFGGSFRRPVFLGYELVTGKIVADSYGEAKQQHTFTLLRDDGSTLRIKGRNLYRNGVWRKPWANESERAKALAEKHARGDRARALREERRMAREAGLLD